MLGAVADRVLPVLKPNQPNASSNVPGLYIGTLCAGAGVGVPSGGYLPIRGPRNDAATRAVTPPTMWTTDEPAKSTWPWPRPKFSPRAASQPWPHTQLPYTG